jgi:hypothetical protein
VHVLHNPKKKAGATIIPPLLPKLNLDTLNTYLCEMSCHQAIGRQRAAEQTSQQIPKVNHSSLPARVEAGHVWIKFLNERMLLVVHTAPEGQVLPVELLH